MSWILSPVGAISSINNIGDVIITTPSNGEVLTYNGSNWVNSASGAGASELADLSDVTTAAVTSGYALMADGAAYVGRALVAADISDMSLVAEVDANTAKVTNATHTGDVTGATALTIAAGAVDVAMLANGTDGELITWDAAGAPAVVAVGTATHVLTSNGAGAAPTFQAAAGGGGGTLILKAADEVVTTSTTLQDDDDLVFSGLTADTWYSVIGYFEITSTAAADWKTQFVFTNAPSDTGSLHFLGNEYSSASHNYGRHSNATFNGSVSHVWGGTYTYTLKVMGQFKTNASTGGTCTFRWAQDASSGSTTLRAGSWLKLETA